MAISVELPVKITGAVVTVPTTADLETNAMPIGALRYVVAEDALYSFDGTTWSPVSTGGAVDLETEVTGVLPVANGGTNSSTALNSNRAVVTTAGKIVESATTSTEIGYVSGVTSAIQTQINTKQATITGGATSITSADLTASRALASDGSGKVAVSAVTSTELGYVSGVTSAIQTQLNAKVDDSQVGVALGVASLDSAGKVPAAQLPNAIMEYQGVWDASTNTPYLEDNFPYSPLTTLGEAYDNNWGLAAGDGAASFYTPSADKTIGAVRVLLTAQAGTTTGTARVRIYSDVAGLPGVALHTSATENINVTDGVYTGYNFLFSGADLTGSTKYWFAIEALTVTAANFNAAWLSSDVTNDTAGSTGTSFATYDIDSLGQADSALFEIIFEDVSDSGVGYVYRVGTAGTVDFGSGNITFAVGDYVIRNVSEIWEKADTTDAVASVNGFTGTVVLDTGDIAESGSLYFTDERAQDAVGGIVASSAKVSLTYVDGTPSITPDIVAGSLVNADINGTAAIARSKLADGTANHVVINGAGGGMSSEALLALSRGGTNKDMTAIAGGIVWTDASSFEVSAAGTAGDWVLSGGTGAPTQSSTATTPKVIDGTSDDTQLRIQGNATQTVAPEIFLVEKSDGTDLLAVTNVGGTKIRGAIDGVAVATGFVGEFLSDASASTTTTTVADTDTDTDMALTLEPGIYLLGYNVAVEMSRVAAGITQARTKITTSADVLVNGTIGYARTSTITAEAQTSNISRIVVINISAQTTYKVRVASSVAAASGAVSVIAESVTGTLTNPDNNSVLWAVRIA